MNLKYLLNLKGLNIWLVTSAMGMNFMWTSLILIFSTRALARTGLVTPIQLGLMVGVFLGTFITGWAIGRIAPDNRGPSYGLYGSLGSVGLLVYAVLPTGIMGLLLSLAALAGGLNGGLSSLKRQTPPE